MFPLERVLILGTRLDSFGFDKCWCGSHYSVVALVLRKALLLTYRTSGTSVNICRLDPRLAVRRFITVRRDKPAWCRGCKSRPTGKEPATPS